MNSDFKILGSKVVYENQWIKLREHQIVRRGDSGIYAVVERDNSVVIVPLSQSGRTILLRQYRFPTESDSWELPMGSAEPGESYESAAIRELKEETNITDARLSRIGVFNPVPGLSPQQVCVFVAKASDYEIEALQQPASVDEIQELRVFELEQVYKMVRQGIITDGFTLVSLFLLRLAESEKMGIVGI